MNSRVKTNTTITGYQQTDQYEGRTSQISMLSFLFNDKLQVRANKAKTHKTKMAAGEYYQKQVGARLARKRQALSHDNEQGPKDGLF